MPKRDSVLAKLGLNVRKRREARELTRKTLAKNTRYKIEVIYTSGWGDAGWTEETDGVIRPLRFKTINCAQQALDDFSNHVKAAVAAGNMDTQENHYHYRIVPVNDRY
jgi:hypothetical protein